MKNTSSSISVLEYQAGAESWLVFGVDNEAQTKVILEELNSTEESFLLIGRIDKLHDFINPVPELAWEIMEDSEKRLVVEFDNIKPRYKYLANSKGRLSIMLNKVEMLSAALRKNQEALWCVVVDFEAKIQPNESLFGSKKLAPERKFWLGSDNQIKVLA